MMIRLLASAALFLASLPATATMICGPNILNTTTQACAALNVATRQVVARPKDVSDLAQQVVITSDGRIRSAVDGSCFSARQATVQNPAEVVTARACTSTLVMGDRWVYERQAGDSKHTIRSQMGTLLMGAESDTPASGSALTMWTADGTAAQKWQFFDLPIPAVKGETTARTMTVQGGILKYDGQTVSTSTALDCSAIVGRYCKVPGTSRYARALLAAPGVAATEIAAISITTTAAAVTVTTPASISGTPIQGGALNATQATFANCAGTTVGEWLRAGAVIATSLSYSPSLSDVGAILTFRSTGCGVASTATTAAVVASGGGLTLPTRTQIGMQPVITTGAVPYQEVFSGPFAALNDTWGVNNALGSWSQQMGISAVLADGSVSCRFKWNFPSSTLDYRDVISYPQCYWGTMVNKPQTAGSTLPKQIGSITSLTNTLTFDSQGAQGLWHLSADDWFATAGGSGTPANRTHEIMIPIMVGSGYGLPYVSDAAAVGRTAGNYTTLGDGGRNPNIYKGRTTIGTPAATYDVFHADAYPAKFVVGATYTVGQLVAPTSTNGKRYRVTVAGTSAAAPSWTSTAATTNGSTITSGGVTFVTERCDWFLPWKYTVYELVSMPPQGVPFTIDKLAVYQDIIARGWASPSEWVWGQQWGIETVPINRSTPATLIPSVGDVLVNIKISEGSAPPVTPVAAYSLPTSKTQFAAMPTSGPITATTGMVIENKRISNPTGACITVPNGVHNVTIRNVDLGPCGEVATSSTLGDWANDVGVLIQGGYDVLVGGITCHDTRTCVSAAVGAKHPIVVDKVLAWDIRGPEPRGQLVQFNAVTTTGAAPYTATGGPQSKVINSVSDKDLSTNPYGYSNPDPDIGPRGTGWVDHVNMFGSAGTSANPILIACNKFRGGDDPSGSGIILGDSGGEWYRVEDNIMVQTTNVGMVGCSGCSNALVQRNLQYSRGANAASFTSGSAYVMRDPDTPTLNPTNITFANNRGVANGWLYGGTGQLSNPGFFNDGNAVNLTLTNNNWMDTTLTPAIWDTTPAACPAQ